MAMIFLDNGLKALMAEGKQYALAVGLMTMSSDDMYV